MKSQRMADIVANVGWTGLQHMLCLVIQAYKEISDMGKQYPN